MTSSLLMPSVEVAPIRLDLIASGFVDKPLSLPTRQPYDQGTYPLAARPADQPNSDQAPGQWLPTSSTRQSRRPRDKDICPSALAPGPGAQNAM
jgi:hypothetical protein